MEEKLPTIDDEADPVATLQEILRKHYGGRLPKGVVASFLRERRREAKRELEEYRHSIAASRS